MKILIVIPARLESSRLPRKLLLNQTGQPLIQHTYSAASQSRLAEQVVVAADDPLIVEAVQQFGGQVCLTGTHHRSGTDRLVEVAEKYDSFDVIVNVQGDEPEIRGADIDRAIDSLLQHPDAAMATLATPIRTLQQLEDPACVKVVTDARGRALYFSRSVIPYPRLARSELAKMFEPSAPSSPAPFLQHVGVYVYRREFLLEFASLPVPACEKLESLEQLRVLDAGKSIMVSTIPQAHPGIDTETDYQAFVIRQRNG